MLRDTRPVDERLQESAEIIAQSRIVETKRERLAHTRRRFAGLNGSRIARTSTPSSIA